MSQYNLVYIQDDECGRYAIGYVFEHILKEGMLKRIFYDGTINTKEEFASLTLRPGTLPFLALRDGEPVAFTWLNSIEGRAARGHFIFFKNSYGKAKSIPLGNFMFSSLLSYKDAKGYILDTLIGVTPESNQLAWRRAIDCGAKYFGRIPHLAYIAERDETEDCVVVIVTRESLGIENEVENGK